MAQGGAKGGARRPAPHAGKKTLHETEAPIGIPCPWHTLDHLPHPPGAPECIPDPGHIGRRLIGMGDLIAWISVVVTDIARTWGPMSERLADLNRRFGEFEKNIFGGE